MSGHEEKPVRKRLNLSEKRALKAAEIQRFATQYGRKAQKGGADPNDRRYDKDTARRAAALSAEDLDRLLREDED